MAASPDMDTLAQLAGLGVEAVERMAEEDITIELLVEVRRPRTHPAAPAAAAAAHALGRRAYAHARQRCVACACVERDYGSDVRVRASACGT